MTDATPTQPTGSGKWIWHKPLTEDVIEFGTLPDPRDARIAELEAALNLVRILAEVNNDRTDWQRLQAAGRIARAALVPPPESDMTITQEELPA